MFTRRKLLLFASFLFAVFFILTCYFSVVLNNYVPIKEVQSKPSKAGKLAGNAHIEHEIKLGVSKLPDQYRQKWKGNDFEIRDFLDNLRGDINLSYEEAWKEARSWVKHGRVYDSTSVNIKDVIHALKTAKIVNADLDSRGTQLKLLLELEGGQTVVFKPQWYDRERIILGNVYAGKDRYGAEILAFYLSALLNLPHAPVSTERIIDIQDEIVPVASAALNETIFKKNNITCIYGKCFYCKREDPACEFSLDGMAGAAIMHIPGKLTSHRSPWQRSYKKNKKTIWETHTDYCSEVKPHLHKKRLLDLIDVAIFDFLMQNGDRHHYELLNDKILLLDNGKGLGNPYVNHIDILAPLYQCCRLRRVTWNRLKELSGGLLRELLMLIPEVQEVVSMKNIQSIDERLMYIYSAVLRCTEKNLMHFEV